MALSNQRLLLTDEGSAMRDFSSFRALVPCARLASMLRPELGLPYSGGAMLRTGENRLVLADGGEQWELPRTTALASSHSPCRVVRLPESGDLLAIWNRVSGGEICRGSWRSRLACALSSDAGESA